MATHHVYWRSAGFDTEAQRRHSRHDVHTGVLTDEHEAATPEMPVLIEEISKRVYRPGDLAPNTVVYVENHPGGYPPIAHRARLAGYRVEHALRDEGMADRPQTPRADRPAEAPRASEPHESEPKNFQG